MTSPWPATRVAESILTFRPGPLLRVKGKPKRKPPLVVCEGCLEWVRSDELGPARTNPDVVRCGACREREYTGGAG